MAAAQKYAAKLGYQIEDWECAAKLPVELEGEIEMTEPELETLRAHIIDSMAVYFGEAKAA